MSLYINQQTGKMSQTQEPGFVPFTNETSRSGSPVPKDIKATNGGTAIDEIIKIDPYLSDYFKDSNNKASFDSLDPALQSTLLQLIKVKQQNIAAGKIVNPNVTLEPSKMAEFLQTAKSQIDPYYAEQINNYGQDLKTSIDRMQQDYDKSVGRAQETFKSNLGVQAENEAQSGLTYGSERGVRLSKAISDQNNALSDASTSAQRNIQDYGRQAERTIGSSALSGLGLNYNVPNYQASASGFSNTGGRSLFSPSGNLTGTIPAQRSVDEITRQNQLAGAENQRRTSDYNFRVNSIYD